MVCLCPVMILQSNVASPEETTLWDSFPTLIIMKIAFFSSLLTYTCHVPPKHCYLSARLHSAATQKRVIFISTATQHLDDEMRGRILTIHDFCRVILAASENT